MPRAVRFDRYGGLEVLQVVEVERPKPGIGIALVGVKAAGINPGPPRDPHREGLSSGPGTRGLSGARAAPYARQDRSGTVTGKAPDPPPARQLRLHAG
jgi:hypothetical protein